MVEKRKSRRRKFEYFIRKRKCQASQCLTYDKVTVMPITMQQTVHSLSHTQPVRLSENEEI